MSAKISSPKLELTVLRAMTHKDLTIAGTVLGSVDESFFDNEESVEIYSAVKSAIAESGKPPSFKLLLQDPGISVDAREFFRNSEATVQGLDDAKRAVDGLGEYRRRRILYELAAKIDKELQASRCDGKKLLQEVSTALAGAQITKTTKDNFLHFGTNNNSLKFVESLIYEDAKEDVIPTGIPEFDRESGGFMRGSLVTIGASSGGGKSLLAGIAMPIAQALMGYKVDVVPLEMSKREMTARVMANLSGIDVTRILQSRLAEGEKDKVFRIYKRTMKRIKDAGGRLTIFKPSTDVDIQETLAALNALGGDVRYIDYLNLLRGAEGDDAWRKLMDMARYAKINAEATNAVNVLLVQVNEEGKIRYSRGVSEHSTNSLVWTAKPEERAKEVGRIQIEQPKSRNSAAFPIEVGLHWKYMRVVKLEDAAAVPDVDDTPANLAADV